MTRERAGGLPTPLTRLYERAGLPFWGLPPPLAAAHGDVPAGHPAVRAGALILTTTAGARHLHGPLPPGCTVPALGERPTLPVADLLAAIRARGGSMVLAEGGPRLLGRLVADGCWMSSS